MKPVCLACLGVLRSTHQEHGFHRRCLESLFDGPTVPDVRLEVAKLQTAGLAMIGTTSISGAQRKISVGLSGDRMSLQVAVKGGGYILKPRTTTFAHLPENEHATMCLARLCDIVVPPFSLLPLEDDTQAYIVRRFDRAASGKLRQEDFCQLALKTRAEKYNGSSELLVRLVRQFTSEVGVELFRLFRWLLFGWWTGNGDMHLKNFSILAEPGSGRYLLSPAYDLVCTRLVIPGDRLALPVGGRDRQLTRRSWLDLASYAGLGRAGGREIDRLAAMKDQALGLLEASFLPSEQQEAYAELIIRRTAALLA